MDMQEKVPPPVDRFVAAIMGFPGVQETEGDMFRERSFRVGGREFLHLHGSAVHIVLPMEVKTRVLAEGKAQEHPYAPRSSSVALYLRTGAQVEDALALARISYEFVASRGTRR